MQSIPQIMPPAEKVKNMPKNYQPDGCLKKIHDLIKVGKTLGLHKEAARLEIYYRYLYDCDLSMKDLFEVIKSIKE